MFLPHWACSSHGWNTYTMYHKVYSCKKFWYVNIFLFYRTQLPPNKTHLKTQTGCTEAPLPDKLDLNAILSLQMCSKWRQQRSPNHETAAVQCYVVAVAVTAPSILLLRSIWTVPRWTVRYSHSWASIGNYPMTCVEYCTISHIFGVAQSSLHHSTWQTTYLKKHLMCLP